ncbi:MAG TPA: LPS export ABC transporter periplasmic protein LptC [Caldimonas sp.]|jgi:lipopolysaccharide export system protein LptC|nr:LPS export ABC transporter periplasmic protein LptC [Caldimonas sp.]HEX4232704.1 LPS export ABC transporter periplasmic protein LptC [Caldimonas sp.]
MALDEIVSAPPGSGLEDDDDVDLSFAGPEPVPTASWPARLLDLASAYLPLLMMAVLASGTWWLVRSAPSVEAPRAEAPPRHEPDYEMANFIVQRFAKDGTLRTQIEGDRLRHFPDTDTLEVDRARILAIDSQGVVTVAVANQALANGDGSEVQLLGDARVTRPAHDGEEQIEFRGEFLHAFRNVEQVRSHLPVVVTQGASVVHADGMEYDNLARVIDLNGHTRATFVSPRRPAAQ